MRIIQLHIPDGKGPYQSLPQLARNYHLQINTNIILSISITEIQFSITKDNTKLAIAPAMFS